MELAILTLKTMLEEAKMPIIYTEDGSVKQIVLLSKRGGYLADAVQYPLSHGYDDNLIEILNAITEEERARYRTLTLGYLPVEEVFKRFKYCYENNTSVYKEEKN